MDHPRPLFRLFSDFFKQTIQILHQINVKKCSSSIQHQDLNTWYFDYETPPLTTRPWLPPILASFLLTTDCQSGTCFTTFNRAVVGFPNKIFTFWICSATQEKRFFTTNDPNFFSLKNQSIQNDLHNLWLDRGRGQCDIVWDVLNQSKGSVLFVLYCKSSIGQLWLPRCWNKE